MELAALGLLKTAMPRIAADGRIAPDMGDVFAHIVFAMMSELALLVVRADDPESARQTAAAAVDEFSPACFADGPERVRVACSRGRLTSLVARRMVATVGVRRAPVDRWCRAT